MINEERNQGHNNAWRVKHCALLGLSIRSNTMIPPCLIRTENRCLHNRTITMADRDQGKQILTYPPYALFCLDLEKAQPRRRIEARSMVHPSPKSPANPYPYHISPSSIVLDLTNTSSLILRPRSHHWLLSSLSRRFLHRPLLLLTLIKSPHTPSLLRLNPLPRNRSHQFLKHRIRRAAPVKEPSLPLPPLSLLFPPQLPLRVLDF